MGTKIIKNSNKQEIFQINNKKLSKNYFNLNDYS